MLTGSQEDLDALAAVRQRLNDADDRADADAFERELAEDIVIMPPSGESLVGRDVCVRFVREAFRGWPTRRYTAALDEVVISGDLAVERGSYQQMTADPLTGKPSCERGRGIWIWRRTPDGWKAWRFIWHVDESDD